MREVKKPGLAMALVGKSSSATKAMHSSSLSHNAIRQPIKERENRRLVLIVNIEQICYLYAGFRDFLLSHGRTAIYHKDTPTRAKARLKTQPISDLLRSVLCSHYFINSIFLRQLHY